MCVCGCDLPVGSELGVADSTEGESQKPRGPVKTRKNRQPKHRHRGSGFNHPVSFRVGRSSGRNYY